MNGLGGRPAPQRDRGGDNAAPVSDTGSLAAGERNYLELRAEKEETQGFDTRSAAAFDLLSPRPRAEIILSWR